MNKMETKEPIALLGAVTDRRLAALRLILAAAGLLIIYVIPYEPDRYLTPVYYTLGVYMGTAPWSTPRRGAGSIFPSPCSSVWSGQTLPGTRFSFR
jgi:hypothetical protein